MLDKERMGKMITLRRKQCGMTQRQLAEELHVSYQAVSRWELGISLPTVEMLYDLANVLETSVDYLLKGEELSERDINYMDSGLDTIKLYDIKHKLQELVTEDESLVYAHYTYPVLHKVDTTGMREPVHVTQNYVPGSKLRLAREYGYDREICEELAAVALNYTCAYGAKPLMFQAGILCGSSSGEQLLGMGKAFKNTCESEKVAFAGLEVACQPINFRSNEYELFATCSGIVEREEILTGSRIREGDVVIGIRTEGINGISYPYVRIMLNRKPSLAYADMGQGHYFLDELMKPTASYASDVAALLEEKMLHDVLPLTNHLVPEGKLANRLPEGLGIRLDLLRIEVPRLFQFIAEQDMISRKFLPYRFHMGIGMIVVVPGDEQKKAMDLIRRHHECVYMGQVEKLSGKEEETIWVAEELKW